MSKLRMRFRPFAEAREYVRKIGLKSVADWREYSKSDKKPPDIPSTPERAYRKEWKNYGDWLGTGVIAPQQREYRRFEDAREYVHALVLKNQKDWQRYCKSGKKPPDIPANPQRAYIRTNGKVMEIGLVRAELQIGIRNSVLLKMQEDTFTL